jgi:hypothetical protein
MPINIRAKGAGGEREVADALNYRAHLAHQKLGLPFSWADDGAQRNQIQTAVGGCDLTNTWGLAIEVKRQEALAINTWWAQACASAKALNWEPVLCYRQNGKKWRVVMSVGLQLPPSPDEAPWKLVRAEMEWELFLDYYQARVERLLAIRAVQAMHVEATMIGANVS